MPRFATRLLIIVSAVMEAGWAQMEIGTQITALRQSPLGVVSASLGARASYDLHFRAIVIAPEIEYNYFPESPIAGYAQAQLLAGVRTGVHNDRAGLFFKVRPGLVFSNSGFTLSHTASTNPAVDVGGVLELSVRPGRALRFDWGDTMMRFPNAVLTGPFALAKPGSWSHSFQSSCGVSIQF